MAPLLHIVVRIKNGIAPNLVVLTPVGTIHAHIRLTIMPMYVDVCRIPEP